MTSRNDNKLRVDDVTEGDFSQVAGTFFPESLLRDYMDLAAKDQSLRCLLLRKKVTILGFVVLVFKRPEFWQNANVTRRLPELVALSIHPPDRGKGYGAQFVGAIEREVVKAKFTKLYLSVSPQNNPRALSFYRNMGFKAIGAPHHVVWEITDSSLITHRGENTLQTMVKVLQ